MPELPKLPIPTTCWGIKEKFNILRKVSNHGPSDSLKFTMKSFPIFAGSGQVANSIGDQLNSLDVRIALISKQDVFVLPKRVNMTL